MLQTVQSYSDVHKMEKEQEVERERDRMRSTKIFDSKLNFNEPPPKVSVNIIYAHFLYCCMFIF